jgi:hypothetical protein
MNDASRDATMRFCALCKMDRRHIDGRCVECRMSDAHDRANRAREALRSTPEGRAWYATRSKEARRGIETLVDEYNEAMKASFMQLLV